MGLFVDLIELGESRTNAALEMLCKAHHDDDSDIWLPMDSPLLARLVELFTQRGIDRLDAFRKELQAWVAGHRHKAGDRVPRPVGAMERWSDGERELVKLYLEHMPPQQWTLDDHMLCVDYLAQRYLPADDMRTEAEWLATRASIMGRVQANMEGVTAKQVDKLLVAMPSTVADAVVKFGGTPAQAMTMQFSATRCAENVRALSDDVRHKMRSVVAEHVAQQQLGVPQVGGQSLESKLLDKFGQLNRDWRRIAVTEAGESLNQGYIASMAPGAKVKRVEQYRNACGFCRKIDGKVVEVVDPATPDKNWDNQIWVGKTNIGRSASPRKRVGNQFIERSPEEMWSIPSGLVHPHCFISPQVPIYTVDGWRPIVDIKVGDMVLTHAGKFRPVNWVLSGARHTGDVVKIVASTGGKNRQHLAEMTPDHPVLTERGWVAAGDLVAGDRIAALAKTCPTCGDAFVNLKHDTSYCCNACIPQTGENQFSVSDPDAIAEAKRKTGEANRRRMQGMTIEQRRELTACARAAASARGFDWLQDTDVRRRGGVSASHHNYTPSPAEVDVAEMLDALGFDPELQHRVESGLTDSAGRRRYWWLDIALPSQKIAIEIDGEPWHGRLGNGRDARRDDDLKSAGWTVFRFSDALAKHEPHRVAEAIARVAMNHNGEYRFAYVTVESTSRRQVSNRKLYNFGVDVDESYIIGRGIVVHNCRGRWVPTIQERPGDDADFGDWMRGVLTAPTRE